jgi:Zn-finger nucleic acid-binding protein
MITLELSDVEIDHCLDCGGIWLDSGELEMLLDDPAKSNQLLESFIEESDHSEIVRKCPICLKPMAKISASGEKPAILLDKCKKGHGLWFDSGELEAICTRAKLDEDSKIVKILADFFGKNAD